MKIMKIVTQLHMGYFCSTDNSEKGKSPKGEEEQSHLGCQTSQLYIVVESFESTDVAASSCRLAVIGNWLNCLLTIKIYAFVVRSK